MAQYSWLGPWPDDTWSTLYDLRRTMDQLFNRVGSGVPSGGVFPPVNLYETPEGYVLTAELPGLRSEDIEISIEGSKVSLRGERRVEYPDDGKTSIHRLERQSGTFRRSFELPVGVDAEKAEAVHRNGILMLRIPKAPQHRPRQITVRSS
jgi:HSP20 family protein